MGWIAEFTSCVEISARMLTGFLLLILLGYAELYLQLQIIFKRWLFVSLLCLESIYTHFSTLGNLSLLPKSVSWLGFAFPWQNLKICKCFPALSMFLESNNTFYWYWIYVLYIGYQNNWLNLKYPSWLLLWSQYVRSVYYQAIHLELLYLLCRVVVN